MLDFRMDTFLALCRTMNYTRAAEELNITQPAVTQHIQYLQRHYGVKLFQYRDKHLFLTEAGAALRSAALTMEHDERELMEQLPLLQKGMQHLRLGATLTVGEYALPPHLGRYMKRHPDVALHLVVGSTRRLLEGLNRGELDAAVVEGYFAKREYDAIRWSMEPYVCVCAAGSALEGPMELEDLFTQTLIRHPGNFGARFAGAEFSAVRLSAGGGNQRFDGHQAAGRTELRHHLFIPPCCGTGAGGRTAAPGLFAGLGGAARIYLSVEKGQCF